jgi:RNA recognition motif-containing protein
MGNRLYVGNLSFNSDQDSLMRLFSEVGAVSDVHVVTDRETGRSRGFGFVTMANAALAAEAISRTNGTMLDGRALRVNEAEERSPRQNRR